MSLPSRLSAEAPDRAERQSLLDEVAAQRLSCLAIGGCALPSPAGALSSRMVSVWELIDRDGTRHGQAAIFLSWRTVYWGRGLCGADMTRREPLIFIVSGETSGDNLAGRLMGALKRETGGRVRFAGVGGPQSERQGLESLFPMSDLSVMGLAEVLPHLPRLVRRLNETTAAARRLKPDAVVTVEFARLLSQARPSSPRLRHPRHPICCAAALGLAARAARASSPSGSITSWRCCPSRCPSSRNMASRAPMSAIRPSSPVLSEATGRPSGRGTGLPPDATCPLRPSRQQGRRSAPHASRLRRRAAASQGEISRPSHRHPGGHPWRRSW